MKAQAALAAAVALLLVACGQPQQPSAPDSAPPPSDQTPSADATPPPSDASAAEPVSNEPLRLSIFCWSEYIPQDVIDEFASETGIDVSVENYASNEEMLAKLMSGGGSYDLIQPSEYVVQALIGENGLAPIDHGMIPNLKNVNPIFLSMSFDPGNRYSIPFMAGTIGIAINTELIEDEIKGYKDVFQEKYRGKIVVVDDARELVSWALSSLGLPVNDISDENLEKARAVLQEWLPLVRVYDSDSPKTAMLNGDAAIGVIWSGEGAILLNEDGEKFKWVVPEEGVHLTVDSLAIPREARHPKNAMLFMNYILRPEVSARISEEFPYLNPNLAARELLPPEALANPASFPVEESISQMEIFEDIGDQATKIDELVTTVKAQ